MTPPQPAQLKWLWPAWALFGVVALAVGGLLGPFAALNAVYQPGPVQSMTELESYATGASGAAMVGAALGILAWGVFGSHLGVPRRNSFFPITLAFSFSTTLAAGALFLAGMALYTGVLPLCLASPALIAIAAAVILAVPRLLLSLLKTRAQTLPK